MPMTMLQPTWCQYVDASASVVTNVSNVPHRQRSGEGVRSGIGTVVRHIGAVAAG